MKRTTFSRWLSKQIDRKEISDFYPWVGNIRPEGDPVKDLAQDALEDEETYLLKDLKAWVEFLEAKGASRGAFRACAFAWVEFYRQEINKG